MKELPMHQVYAVINVVLIVIYNVMTEIFIVSYFRHLIKWSKHITEFATFTWQT